MKNPKSKKPRVPNSHGTTTAPTTQGGNSNSNRNSNKNMKPKHRKMNSFAKVSNTFGSGSSSISNNNKTYNNNINMNNKGGLPSEKKSSSSASASGQQNSNQHRPKRKQQQQQQNRRPTVPFGRKDRILLVGEGDFSFAYSLVTHHRCRDIIATSYDSKETLYSKYPQAEKNISDILSAFSRGNNTGSPTTATAATAEEEGKNNNHHHRKKLTKGPNVLFSVDARKLGFAAGGGKDVKIGFPPTERKRPAWVEAEERKKNLNQNQKLTSVSAAVTKDIGHNRGGGPWDVICFNFPHVGGISTDVNRQVRANQELLVAFFKACVPLLSHRPEVEEEQWDDSEDSSEEEEGEDEGQENSDGIVLAKRERRTEAGQILVSLFEGEPYTLWNIRDLARHAGLKVVTSFKFPWACYPGYSHARTLGEIEAKDGGRGGWRGEDREARMYVFEVKQDDSIAASTPKPRSSINVVGGKRKKRSAESDDSDSD